jgi:outer membrane lipoprotein LolB
MSFARARAALAPLLVFAALAGCRTAPVPVPAVIGPGADAPWPVQREQLGRLDHYTLAGRVAVAASGQGFSASLRYQQAAARSDLALDGPLGVGGLRVSLDGQTLGLTNSRGQRLDGELARADLEERLGFALPLAELRWWLLGLPAPGEADIEDEAGEIRAFTQNGWRVSVNARAPALGFALPQRLTAERDGARLKLFIERWQP